VSAPRYAVQAILTAPGVFHGCTINLWTGDSQEAGTRRLPALEAKHAASYRAFEVVDLDAPDACAGIDF
jgi:hypothetical protein